MAIFERDYDVGFPSETEPEELEAWQPIRTDGLQWGSPMMPGGNTIGTVPFVSTKAHCISSFNASAALSVLIGRVISSVYAIGVRVLGQSSEALLSLLDQSLASWYLALPVHLAYSPGTKIVPLPHVLSLHLQFYSALLLLHRPLYVAHPPLDCSDRASASPAPTARSRTSPSPLTASARRAATRSPRSSPTTVARTRFVRSSPS